MQYTSYLNTISAFYLLISVSSIYLALGSTLHRNAIRAYYAGPGLPRIGLPDVDYECDVLYGRPDIDDCDAAAVLLFPEADEDFYGPESVQVREYRGADAVPRFPTYPQVQGPITKTIGNCVITVVTTNNLEFASDLSTWHDVVGSAIIINYYCIMRQGIGGLLLSGASNGIGVYVYTSDSDFAERSANCRVFCKPPFRPSSQDKDDPKPSLCLAGASAGWGTNGEACCPGFKFVEQSVKNTWDMFGVDAVGYGWPVGVCLAVSKAIGN
ncbi:MAG: hypothetical protein M1827_003482 [Pycnora praestabilis]|nr:MAG: hypothetical protein M1827_003482 [Pycnora praestabilis]